jgi:hypothetical protein
MGRMIFYSITWISHIFISKKEGEAIFYLMYPHPTNCPNMLTIVLVLLSTQLIQASPLDYAGSFSKISSGHAVDKLTPEHFATSEKISKAADELGSKAVSQAIEFKSAKNQFLESTHNELSSNHAASHGAATESTNSVNTLRSVHITPTSAAENAALASETTNKHYSKTVAASYHESLLEVASTAQSKVGVLAAASACEVCVYVVENKQMHQPFLCRGLKDPAYQQTVSPDLPWCLVLILIQY